MEKITVYPLQKNETRFQVGISDNVWIGDTSTLKKFKYINIESATPEEIYDEHGNSTKVWILTFDAGDEGTLEFITKQMDHWFNSLEVPDSRKTISEVLLYINKIFQMENEMKAEKKYFGDLGEMFFLTNLEKLGINWKEIYQNDEKSLFDAYFKNGETYVEVKTTTLDAKQIYVDMKQLIEEKNNLNIGKIKFCCIALSKKQNGSNIFDIISKLKNKSDLVEEIEMFWKASYENNQKIIDNYKINESTQIFFLEDNVIPKFEIINQGGYAGGKIKISINSSKKLSFDETIKNIVNKK